MKNQLTLQPRCTIRRHSLSNKVKLRVLLTRIFFLSPFYHHCSLFLFSQRGGSQRPRLSERLCVYMPQYRRVDPMLSHPADCALPKSGISALRVRYRARDRGVFYALFFRFAPNPTHHSRLLIGIERLITENTRSARSPVPHYCSLKWTSASAGRNTIQNGFCPPQPTGICYLAHVFFPLILAPFHPNKALSFFLPPRRSKVQVMAGFQLRLKRKS